MVFQTHLVDTVMPFIYLEFLLCSYLCLALYQRDWSKSADEVLMLIDRACVENLTGKGESACYGHFLFLQHVLNAPGSLKFGTARYKV